MKLKKKIPKNVVPFKEVYSALNYCRNKEKGVGRLSEIIGNMYVAMSPVFLYKVVNPLITEDFIELHEMYSIPKQKVYNLVEEVKEKALKEKEPLRLKDLMYERDVTFYNNRVCILSTGDRNIKVSEKIFRLLTKTFNEESFILLPPEDNLKEGLYVYSEVEGKEMFFMPFGDSENPKVNYVKEEEKENVKEEGRNKPKLKLKRK